MFSFFGNVSFAQDVLTGMQWEGWKSPIDKKLNRQLKKSVRLYKPQRAEKMAERIISLAYARDFSLESYLPERIDPTAYKTPVDFLIPDISYL